MNTSNNATNVVAPRSDHESHGAARCHHGRARRACSSDNVNERGAYTMGSSRISLTV
jgi:hypothetical protein